MACVDSEVLARGLRAAPTKTPRARRAPGPPRAFPVDAPLPDESAPPETGGARPRANPSAALVAISWTLPDQRPPFAPGIRRVEARQRHESGVGVRTKQPRRPNHSGQASPKEPGSPTTRQDVHAPPGRHAALRLGPALHA